MTIPGIVIIIPGWGDGPFSFKRLGSRSGAGRATKLHPGKAGLGRATLDNYGAIGVPLERGGIHNADTEVVHAKNQRSPAAPVRARSEPRSDRSQLFDLPRRRLPISETSPGGGRHLAAAGGLGRSPVGRGALRAL